jgi:Mce-associated membrane protein
MTKRLLPWGIPLVLTVVLVALLATSAWFWFDDRGDDGRGSASTTARIAAVTFFSLDHDHPSASIDRLLAMSTGGFKSDYAKQRTTLEKQVQSKQLTVTARVPDNGTALEYLSPTRSQVLVAVDTTTALTNGRDEKGSYRIRVVLSKVDSKWLVSDLEQVG